MEDNKSMEVFAKAPIRKAVLQNALPAMAAMLMVLIYNSRLELKRAKSRQTPIREQLRRAEEQVKKQPQRELTKEAAHGDR